jgi:hypothetical protein
MDLSNNNFHQEGYSLNEEIISDSYYRNKNSLDRYEIENKTHLIPCVKTMSEEKEYETNIKLLIRNNDDLKVVLAFLEAYSERINK